MPLVEHVHYRHHIHCGTASVGGINIVVQGDKAYSVSGKNIIDILPDLNIIAPEARQILYDNSIDFARLRVLKHTLYIRAVEIGARPAVVDILVHNFTAKFRRIALQNYALVVYGHGFARLVVVARQPHI